MVDLSKLTQDDFEGSDFVCQKHGVYGREFPYPTSCGFCGIVSEYEERLRIKDVEIERLKNLVIPRNPCLDIPSPRPPISESTVDDLIYSAFHRCPCGAGMAYHRHANIQGNWDCSKILLGTADPSITHSAQLPFLFYEITSENQPSANGNTTRPKNESSN
jgi:hypothetical protein